jgi:predicted protein tyrosine phosphatase
MIHVCSLARLHATVEETGARHIVTLINAQTPVLRPPGIAAENHLFLGMNDITCAVDGFTAPCEEHVEQLLDFVGRWDRGAPLVVHCFAGISRSTAAAYVAACALNPRRDERAIAYELRRASPIATPNALIVELADRKLGRRGRMASSIAAIGRGIDAAEGVPFRLDLE